MVIELKSLIINIFLLRFNAANPLVSVEARFEYFVKEVLPKQRDPLMSHTLIYVPSYFDYVCLRNYFKKEDISFVQICEYSKVPTPRDLHPIYIYIQY